MGLEKMLLLVLEVEVELGEGQSTAISGSNCINLVIYQIKGGGWIWGYQISVNCSQLYLKTEGASMIAHVSDIHLIVHKSLYFQKFDMHLLLS